MIVFTFVLTLFAFTTDESMWLPTGQMSATATNYVRALIANSYGDLYASVWAVGVYKTTNDGTNWTFSGLSGKRVSYLTVAPNGDIYGLSNTQSFSFIHRSTDNGITWTDVYTGSYPLNFAGNGSIVFPSDGSIVAAFAVTVGPLIGNVATFVFKSTNGGNDWFQTQVIGAGFVGGMVITSDGKNFTWNFSAGVVYSTNNGNSFTNLATFPPIYIKTILYASHNTIYVSDAYGLNRSTDNGLTFTDIGSHSAGVSLRAACLNSSEDLFVSLDNRNVFHSTNRGDNWTQVNDGLPTDTYIYSFTLCDGTIFAGTNNSGVYVYDDLSSISSSNNFVNDFKLYQNYPNPFNPNTVISYRLAVSGFAALKVIDVLGKEVVTLVNQKQDAGNYEVEFNGQDLPSGIYYYKIQTNNFTSTKKMLLVK
ncbi:MAG: T9SS type A sorting domain-containing protein [Bacteroidota bacterium]|nr:T9SS type A sorting domain-containing protein [Bacteroidota bacterium]